MEYENTKTPSIHRRFDSVTLSHLASHGESNPNFPWKNSQWDNIVGGKNDEMSKSFGEEACILSLYTCRRMLYIKLVCGETVIQTVVKYSFTSHV